MYFEKKILILSTTYEIYAIKIILLEISFKYESNDINFMACIVYFIG
jgi:hypothetical protein